MAMNATRLLDRLGQQGLLAPRVVDRLREQLASSPQPVTADSLAKLLVKKNLLTADQAKMALQALAASDMQTPARPPANRDDDLGLAPERPLELTPVSDDEVLSVEDAVRPPSTVRPGATPPVAAPTPPLRGTAMPPALPAMEVIEPLGDDDQNAFDDEEAMDVEDVGRPLSPRRRGLAGLLDQLTGGGRRKKIAANRWDSPLILFGGGGLLLLLVVAVGLYFFLTRGTGDEAFQLANENYRQQAYGQAIGQLQQFLSDFPGHPKESEAKVRIVLAEIWSLVERKNWEQALTVVQQKLPTVDGETSFDVARPELASLLPEIMEGFAQQANDTKEVAEAEALLGKAELAMKEIDNPSYLPTSVRRDQQPRIEQIVATLESVRRRISQNQELETAVTSIRQFTEEGQLEKAYGASDGLLRKYPDLEADSRLLSAIYGINAREKAAVTPLQEPPQTLTEERDALSMGRPLLLSHRQGDAVDSLKGQTICVIAGDAAFGIQANDGRLLWRRSLGLTSRTSPIELESPDGGDLILVDERHSELVRVRARDGKVAWRLPCPGVPLHPTVSGGTLYFAGSADGNGWVMAVNPDTGKVTGGAKIPRTVSVGPTVDQERQRLYLLADHSSLYQFSLQDWSCVGVHYLGHAAGTVRVPLAIQSGAVLCAENAGPDFALLHLIAEKADKPGEMEALIESPRLEGQVVVPMHTFGRRILLTTNRGAVQVWELDRSQASQPLRLAAQNTSSVPPNTACYALLDEGRLWVADRQLTFFELQTSRGQLARKWLNLKNDVFLAPLRRKGSLLIHVRQRDNKTGVTVAATQVGADSSGRKDGEIVWQTELALRTVGQPIVGDRPEVGFLTEDGQLFVASSDAIQSGVMTEAQAVVTDATATPLETLVPWTGGRAIGIGTTHDRLTIYEAKAALPLRVVSLDLDGGKPSAAPMPFANGMIVGTNLGAVQLIDPATGKSLADPYLAGLSPDANVQWLPAAVTDELQTAIITDRTGRIFRMKLVEKPKPHLEAERQSALESKPIAAPVVLGSTYLLVTRGASQDRVHRYKTEDLEPLDHTDLPGRLTWGPKRSGTRVWMQIDFGPLLGISEQGETASIELKDAPFIGEPFARDNLCLFASVRGKVIQVDASSGELVKEHDFGVELGNGPALVGGKRLVVNGGDGTLYFKTWDP